MLGGNTQPAVHWPTAHHCNLCIGSADKLVGLCRVNTNENPTLTARSDSQVSVNQERHSPEHFLLGQTRLVAEQLTQSLSQILVICHQSNRRPGLFSPATANGAQSRRAPITCQPPLG